METEIPSTSGNNRGTQTTTPSVPTNNNDHERPSSLYGTPSRVVRTNWLHYLRISWQRISRTSKLVIGATLFIGLAQIVITIVMLIIDADAVCDKPLNTYLIVFLVRLGLSLPLMLHQHLRPSGYPRRDSAPAATITDTTVTAPTRALSTVRSTASPLSSSVIASSNNAVTSPSTSPSLSSSQQRQFNETVTNTSTDTQPHEQQERHEEEGVEQQQQQQQLYRPSFVSRSWLDRVKSLLDLISILWFVVGNYLIFTASDQCHRDARFLFYTTLTWILLGYFLVLIPLLLCTTVVFCLPCLLVAMRAMNVDYATGMVGANKNEIDAIPVFEFKPKTSDDQQEQQVQQVSSTSSATLPSASKSLTITISVPEANQSHDHGTDDISTAGSTTSPKRRSHGFIRRFLRRYNKQNAKEDEETAYKKLTLDANDASCTICLSDYEIDDLICILRCRHHFHKDCVHEWLALNYKCPLCQRDFRGEKEESSREE